MPGKNRKEAIENFAGFICETLSCITDIRPLAYQKTDKLYILLFEEPAQVSAQNGDRFYVSVAQTFTVNKQENGNYKVHTREYSYIFSSNADPGGKSVLSYHWHPEASAVRDPHLHISITPQVGYPEIERRISRAHCGGSVCSDRFFGLLSGKIVQLVVVVAVGM